MYNIDFKVKYHDIEQELVSKLKKEECQEYNLQDVLDICEKLYHDELTSVFYADNLMDDKIDMGIKSILDKMLLNIDFKNIINEMRDLMYTEEEFKAEIDCNSELILGLTLFSKDVFYILHKCVCQQMTVGIIDNNLLVELKEQFITVMNKQ